MGFPPSFLFAAPDLKPELKKITFPFFATPDLTPARRPAVRRPSVVARLPSCVSATGWSLDAEQCPPPNHPVVVPRERASLAPLPPERASPAPLPPERHRFERERSRERDGVRDGVL
ncbi:hypothetical protein GUJ93_ZPchr0002g24120 [Zizania palustris]|uniref:Uncharacterized protein n=1 Tax=Zizania palustris TaxID=103762 RepID=A0A8J5S9D6_ZIZPA|nr:hypothetical protein GUJ93_ZPchr0002g24120 [Zizania palustris]